MDSGSRVVFLDGVTDSPAYEKNHAVRLREELRSRWRLFEEKMDETLEPRYRKTESAFSSLRHCGPRIDSISLCRLRDEHDVAVLPGMLFGPSAEANQRISFAAAAETIESGMSRVMRFFESLDGRKKR